MVWEGCWFMLEYLIKAGQYEPEFSVFLSIYFVNSFYMKEEPGAHSPQFQL